jgi:hypothetical protein
MVQISDSDRLIAHGVPAAIRRATPARTGMRALSRP